MNVVFAALWLPLGTMWFLLGSVGLLDGDIAALPLVVVALAVVLVGVANVWSAIICGRRSCCPPPVTVQVEAVQAGSTVLVKSVSVGVPPVGTPLVVEVSDKTGE